MTEQNIDDLKRIVLTRLEEVIDEGTSPKTLESILGIGYRKIYRWLSSDMWKVSSKEMQILIDFRIAYSNIHNSCIRIVRHWNEGLKGVDPTTKRMAFSKKFINILDSRSDDNMKAIKLTRYIVMQWAEAKRKR